MENEEIKEGTLDGSMKVENLDKSETVENSNIEILKGAEVENLEKSEAGESLIFFKRVLREVIDQVIVIALSVVLLLLSNTLLKAFGFYIVEREPIFFMLYVIINVLYGPICKVSKLNTTIGTKINFK